MITPDDILTIASRAVAGVYRRWPEVIPWDDWDWDDARQAAAEGVVRAICRHAATHHGYLYVAAKQAATRWLWRERLGRSVRPASALNLLITQDHHPARRRTWFDVRRKKRLWRLLVDRKRNAMQEAAIDIQIVDMLLAGVPHRDIARIIGITPNALYKRRQRIRARLRRYLAKWEDCDENVQNVQ